LTCLGDRGPEEWSELHPTAETNGAVFPKDGSVPRSKKRQVLEHKRKKEGSTTRQVALKNPNSATVTSRKAGGEAHVLENGGMGWSVLGKKTWSFGERTIGTPCSSKKTDHRKAKNDGAESPPFHAHQGKMKLKLSLEGGGPKLPQHATGGGSEKMGGEKNDQAGEKACGGSISKVLYFKGKEKTEAKKRQGQCATKEVPQNVKESQHQVQGTETSGGKK